MTQKEVTCAGCSVGCTVKVTMEEGKILEIKGNNCHRGEQYARTKVSKSSRIVTSTVEVNSGRLSSVPCMTKGDVPEELVNKVLEELKDVVVEAPISYGDILVENIAGTGINIVATKTIEKVYYK